MKRSQEDGSRPARIAVFHLNQVGDLVFSLPALAAIRAGFPEATVWSVLRDSLAPLLEASTVVDEALTHKGSRNFLATADRLRDLRIDLAVCLSESPRSRLLAYLSGAPRRVGLDGGPLASLLSERVEKCGLPSTSNNLRVVRELGCSVPQESYVGLLQPSDADRDGARRLLAQAGSSGGRERLVILAPGVSKGREHKRWPVDRFAGVAAHIAALPGFVAVTVGAEESRVAPDAEVDGWVDLVGRTSLRELLGLLSLSALFVGNDSGVLHVAACLGVPCVGLYGPTDPGETGPQGEGHCVLRAHHGDLATLTADAAVAAIDRLLVA